MPRVLIASDVDGTLLLYGMVGIPQRVFELVNMASDLDVAFAVASGRDYASLLHLFEQVKNQVYFISTNGGQIYYQDEKLYESNFDKETCRIILDAIPETFQSELMLSTSNGSVLWGDNESFHNKVRSLGNKVSIVSDLDEIEDNIIKVSLYCAEGSFKAYPALAEALPKCFHVTVSGPKWIDINSSDKGHTLAKLGQELDVSPDHTYALGDQYNDLGMLDYAGHKFLMADAPADIVRRGYPLMDDAVAKIEQILTKYKK